MTKEPDYLRSMDRYPFGNSIAIRNIRHRPTFINNCVAINQETVRRMGYRICPNCLSMAFIRQ